MKYLFLFITLISITQFSCKTDAIASKKATYPAIWAEKNVPAFTSGIISSDKFDNSERKLEHTVILETESSFEEIYNWHKSTFATDGWKLVRDIRKDIGEDIESIILVHTKGNMKHNIVVLKSTLRTNQVKTIFSYFN